MFSLTFAVFAGISYSSVKGPFRLVNRREGKNTACNVNFGKQGSYDRDQRDN